MIDELNRTMRTIIRTVMGMGANTVRPAHQHGPTFGPTDEFATVDVIDVQDIGPPALSTEDVAVADVYDHSIEHLDSVKRATISVNFYKGPATDPSGQPRYSNAAFDKASTLLQRLNRTSGLLLLQRAGICLVGHSQPRNLTEAVDNVNESRGQVDLVVTFVHRESETVATIGSIPNLGLQVEWSPDRIDQRTIEIEETTP